MGRTLPNVIIGAGKAAGSSLDIGHVKFQHPVRGYVFHKIRVPERVKFGCLG